MLSRGLAQSGSAPGLGPGGRRFESCSPDQCLLLSVLFGDRSKQPFFKKSAIHDSSVEWTGVDKNRRNYANSFEIGVINNIYRLL